MRKAALLHRLWPLGAALVAAAIGAASPAWGACAEGQVACGTRCMWNRQTCCASVGFDTMYCAAGRTCNPDGATCGGSALSCPSGTAAGISSCGTDSCSCVQSCTKNTECSTGCCVTPTNNSTSGMYCAPACACTSSGVLVVGCGEGGTPQTDGGTPRYDGGGGGGATGPIIDPFGAHDGKGCSLGGAGLAGAGAGVFFLAVALLWRRRRGQG